MPRPGLPLVHFNDTGRAAVMTTETCERRSGGEAFGGEYLVRWCFVDIRLQRGSFFLDLSEQPPLNRGGRPALARHDRRRDGGP
jgi:hypothetical protein